MGNGALYMAEDKYERSRKNVATLSKFEIKFTGPFKNGMKWSDPVIMDPKGGIFHVVNTTKTSVHLVPEGGTMWDKFSVPKNKMKVVRVVK